MFYDRSTVTEDAPRPPICGHLLYFLFVFIFGVPAAAGLGPEVQVVSCSHC